MTGMNTAISFESAYRQLRAAERAYVDAYVTDAIRTAGLRGERVSDTLYRPVPTEVVEASRGMLDRPLVRAAITEQIREAAENSEMTPRRIVAEIAAVSFSNIMDFMQLDADGLPEVDLRGVSEAQLRAIKSIEIEETGTPLERGHKRKIKLQLHDKLASLKMLGDHTGGLWSPDNTHWKQDSARPNAPALSNGATVEAAGDLYAQMING